MQEYKKQYDKLSISVNDFTRRYQMRENFIASFTVTNRIYLVLGTSHSLDMLEERGVNKYHVAGLILSLGEKLHQHNNSGKHIIASDETKGISVLFTVERGNVVVITVLDKAEMLISQLADTEGKTIVETA